MTESLIIASKALQPLVNSVGIQLKRIRAERQASKAGSSQPINLTRALLLQTYRRIQGSNFDDSWWRELLDRGAHSYIAPDFLRSPILQDWLRINAVEQDLLSIAEARLLGTPTDNESDDIDRRLRQSYSKLTGEAEYLATGPVKVVVAILIAGFIAAIPADQQALAALTQQANLGINQLHVKLDSVQITKLDPFVQSVHTEQLEKELSNILKYRLLDRETAVRRILDLVRDLEEGSKFEGSTEATKNEVRYWVARLCASNSETLATAKSNRTVLNEDQITHDLVVVDALIASSSGDKDTALKLVRDIDHPDARTVLFLLLLKHEDESAAIALCDGIDPTSQPEYFNHAGWINWGLQQTQCGHWVQAAEGLKVVETHLGWEPFLALIEGIVNAALLVPNEKRGDVFNSIPLYPGICANVDPTKERYRVRALECFEFLVGDVDEWVEARIRNNIKHWCLWLRLMNPNTIEVESVQEEIRKQMQNGVSAVSLVPLVWAFGIDYNDEPLRVHLRKCKRFGGLEREQVAAECFLNIDSLNSTEFASYLEDNMEQLDHAMHPSFTTSMLFSALLKDKQTDRARELISKRAGHLEPIAIRRMEVVLNEADSTDKRLILEKLYEESHDLVDLHNLIVHLKEVRDFEALEFRLREMFKLRPSAHDAVELVSVLNRHVKNHESVLTFLEKFPQLVSQNEELQEAKAWALFHAGCYSESQTVNASLLTNRHSLNDLILDINLSIATGDWDRLPAIVEREWPHRQKLDPSVLITLARISAQQGASSDRVVKLARLAADKSSDDPVILASAYGIHFELGVDDQADIRWLTDAVEQSTEDGPVWRSDLRELVEKWIPTMKEQNDRITHMLFAGEAPLSLAAAKLNISMSRMFLEDKCLGSERHDGRCRPIIPIESPLRSAVAIQSDWTVGLDVSSILVLWRIGHLKTVIEKLGHVKLSPDTITSLFHERSKVRFHQPSRVRQAREIRSMLNHDQIKVMSDSVSVNSAEVEEFGVERAELMEASLKNQGIVVCVMPLQKFGSLDVQVADVTNFDGLLCSPADLCKLAFRRGGTITSQTYERAMNFLAGLNQIPKIDLPESCLDGPVYIDEIALSYLYSAQILQELVSSGIDLQVHVGVREESNALLEASDISTDLAKEIEQVVSTLRLGIESGKISILPRLTHEQDSDLSGRIIVSSLTGLIETSGECDAICIDDRFLNSRSESTGQDGTSVPVVTALDICQYLWSQNVLDGVEFWKIKHKLREAGFVFVSIEADELFHWLETTEVNNGQMIESAELKTIRQVVNGLELHRLCSEQEQQVLEHQMQTVCAQIFGRLWQDTSVDSGNAAVFCTWVWRYLVLAFCPPSNTDSSVFSEELQRTIHSQISALLLFPMMLDAKERREAYQAWVRSYVVAQLMPANIELFKSAVMTGFNSILNVDQHRELLVHRLFELVPDSVQDSLVRSERSFAEKRGDYFKDVIGIGPSIQLITSELVQAARKVFASSTSEKILDVLQTCVVVKQSDIGKPLHLMWEDAEQNSVCIEVPELSLVCPDSEERISAFRTLVEQLGPTTKIPIEFQEKIIQRTFSDDEMSFLFREKIIGVSGIRDQLEMKIRHKHQIFLPDIVPNSLEYWERLCGPSPKGHQAEDWYQKLLIPYRKKLLNDNLKWGLDICCLGATRADFSPATWIEGFEDDDAWEALQSIEDCGNPIVQLSMLDIALYRVHDERFRSFSEHLIDVLLKPLGELDQSKDSYRIFHSLCDVILNRLSLVDGASSWPSYWRRMCAWLQTGTVIRSFNATNTPINAEAIEEWSQQNYSRAGEILRLLDSQEEPLVLASTVGARSLRQEVIRRLRLLKQTHEDAGRDIPKSQDIESVITNVQDSSTNDLLLVPGPAELHIRADRSLPQNFAEYVADLWSKGDVKQAIAFLAGSSQYFKLPDHSLDGLRLVLKQLTIKIGETEFDDVVSQLNAASIVAAATSNTLIADDIAMLVRLLAKNVTTSSEVDWIVRILLQAAGTFSDAEEWRYWLDSKLVDVAQAIPTNSKESLVYFVEQLEIMETVLPVERWFQLNAKRIAIAGVQTAV